MVLSKVRNSAFVTYSHAVFIDESGNGSPVNSAERLWFTAAVALPFAHLTQLRADLNRIRTAHFRSSVDEIKGTAMPHHLRPGSTIDGVSNLLLATIQQIGAHVWVTGTQSGVNPLPQLAVSPQRPKDIARQLVLERINGFLNTGRYAPDEFLIVWDISGQKELDDFSANVAAFHNAYSGAPLNPRMAPAVLGGLSHDWAGIQLADVLAHFAVHYQGHQMGLAPSRADKANAWANLLHICLQRDAYGRTVGWKFW